jgi:archaellum biogenesis ATPase FlaH
VEEEIVREMIKRSKEVEKTVKDHINWCESQSLELIESGIHTKEEEAALNLLKKEAKFWEKCLGIRGWKILKSEVI